MEKSEDRESHQRDLYEAIERSEFPRWALSALIIPRSRRHLGVTPQMKRNWLDQIGDIGIVVVATCMLIVSIYLAQALIGMRLEARICERYAPVCRITSRMRQPIKLFVPAVT